MTFTYRRHGTKSKRSTSQGSIPSQHPGRIPRQVATSLGYQDPRYLLHPFSAYHTSPSHDIQLHRQIRPVPDCTRLCQIVPEFHRQEGHSQPAPTASQVSLYRPFLDRPLPPWLPCFDPSGTPRPFRLCRPIHRRSTQRSRPRPVIYIPRTEPLKSPTASTSSLPSSTHTGPPVSPWSPLVSLKYRETPDSLTSSWTRECPAFFPSYHSMDLRRFSHQHLLAMCEPR